MKKRMMIAAFLLPLIWGCQKEQVVCSDESASKLVSKSFSVSVPDTRTFLDSNGKSVVWEEGDVINVIGVTADGTVGQYPFTLKAGDGGKASVTFEGEVGANDETFYAIYPNYEIDVTKIATNLILLKSNMACDGDFMQQKGYDGGFDPEFGLMVAVADESGNLPFSHVMSYFKFIIGVDDVTKVTFSTSGDIRFGARVQYEIGTGKIDTQSAKKAVDLTPAEGSTFEKGKTYYLAFPTRSEKKIKNLTISYTNTSGSTSSVSVNNSDFLSLVPSPGKIYNIGCPPISFTPVIQAEAPSKLAFDAEGGSFTYSISNAPEGAVASASIASGTWVSNVAVNGNMVSFDCEKNDAIDAEERTATIQLSYAGAEDVVVTITQNSKVVSKESHLWNFAEFTDEQMVSITGLAADEKATAGQTWDFGDGLTMVTNSSSKWNKQTVDGTAYKWVATGGKYGSNQKFFSFTTNSVGTVTVLYASGGSASRALTLNANGTEKTDSDHVSSGTSDLKTVTFASVPKGTIMLYSKDDNIRVYSISFMED